MWVRSQNKDLIIDANIFWIQQYGNTEFSIKTVFNNDEWIIGFCKNKEEAFEQLDKIHWALSNMKVNVFQIK